MSDEEIEAIAMLFGDCPVCGARNRDEALTDCQAEICPMDGNGFAGTVTASPSPTDLRHR